MKVRLFVMGVGLALAVFAASPVRADFIYEGDGQMFVTQTMLNNDWVQIKIDLLTSKPFGSIAGGFQGLNSTVFSQNPANKAFELGGEDDTAFVGEGTGFFFAAASKDTAQELSTTGSSWIGGSWGPLNSRFTLVQLVVSRGGEVKAFEAGSQTDMDGLVLYGDDGQGNSELSGFIHGSMSAVPEPSSIALSLIGCGCGMLGLVVRRRRRRLA